MPRYSTVISSPWPIESAFDYLSDFANSEGWDPGVAEARQVSWGPVSVDSEFDLVVRFLGRRMTLRYRVIDFVPARRVVFESSSARLRSVDSLDFKPRLDGCEITYDADLRFIGAAALCNPLLAVFFRQIGNRARDSLRALVGVRHVGP